MATRYVLGPFHRHDEPTPPPPPPGLVGAVFGDPAVAPGGVVKLTLKQADSSEIRPINLYAVYASPVDSVPPVDQLTPEWFFAGGFPTGVTAVSEGVDSYDIVVPGVQPGLHFVQTILEYPA